MHLVHAGMKGCACLPNLLYFPGDSDIYYSNKVVVLVYHDVSPEPLNALTLPVDRFEEQLRLMRDEGFNWIAMDQYVDFVTRGRPVPDNAVLLTFDDGYESFYRYAYPLLLKYEAPATNFLIVDTIGSEKEGDIPKLTWEQAREMSEHGISFYSHSFDSHRLLPISADGKKTLGMLASPVYRNIGGVKRMETQEEYLARIKDDLSQANNVLAEKLGNTRKVLAFPYGDYSKDLLKTGQELGIEVTFTVNRGINGPGDRNAYRVDAGGMWNKPAELIRDMKTAISRKIDCPSFLKARAPSPRRHLEQPGA